MFSHQPLLECILWWVFGPWPVHYRLVCLAVTSLWWISELQTEPPVSILITSACFCTGTQHRCKSLPFIRLTKTSSLPHLLPVSLQLLLFPDAVRWQVDPDKLKAFNYRWKFGELGPSLFTNIIRRSKRMKYISIFNWRLMPISCVWQLLSQTTALCEYESVHTNLISENLGWGLS